VRPARRAGSEGVRRYEPDPPLSAGHIVMTDPEGNEFCLGLTQLNRSRGSRASRAAEMAGCEEPLQQRADAKPDSRNPRWGLRKTASDTPSPTTSTSSSGPGGEAKRPVSISEVPQWAWNNLTASSNTHAGERIRHASNR
jgi:hypothetical protein